MSLAVTLPSPSLSRRSTRGFESKDFSSTSLRFSTMSVTSSTTSGMVVISCSAVSILTAVIAVPWSDDSRMRRRLLPSVVPKPRSSGSQVNLPYVSVSDSGSTSSLRGRIRSRQLRAMKVVWVVVCVPAVAICVFSYESRAKIELQTRALARVQLHDELFGNRHRQIVARGQRGQLALEVVLVQFEPLRHAPAVDCAQALEDARHLLRRLLHLDLVARATEERRDVDPRAVHLEVTVANQLARFRVIGGEAEPVDDVVEAPLEELQQVLTGDALHADRLVVVAAELPLGEAVDALHLLLLAQLRTVVRQLAAARLALLAGGVSPALVPAPVRVGAVPREEQLHVFAPAEPANRSRVISHLSDSPPLRGPATVVGDGGEISN